MVQAGEPGRHRAAILQVCSGIQKSEVVSEPLGSGRGVGEVQGQGLEAPHCHVAVGMLSGRLWEPQKASGPTERPSGLQFLKCPISRQGRAGEGRGLGPSQCPGSWSRAQDQTITAGERGRVKSCLEKPPRVWVAGKEGVCGVKERAADVPLGPHLQRPPEPGELALSKCGIFQWLETRQRPRGRVAQVLGSGCARRWGRMWRADGQGDVWTPRDRA